MADINSFGGCTISTLREKRRDGIHGIAYCPICDHTGESPGHGNGGKHAVTISLGKVRMHMRLKHHVNNGTVAVSQSGTHVR
ncbi:MAG: hypothetical protein WAO02_01745 [Verrucomicrobiia bacterium]